MRTLLRLGSDRIVPTVLLSLTCLPPTATADTVEISGRIHVDGKIVREADSGNKPHLVVEVDPELRVAIPKSRVRKTTTDDDLQWYRALAAQAGENAEAHYQLARQCKAKGLLAQRDYHFRRVIEIEPDHSKARYALGYAPDGNEWVPYEQLQRERGLVFAGGRWQVPEVYAREQASEEAAAAAKVWIKELTRLRTTIRRGDKRSADAYQTLIEITDPLASTAFAEALAESRGGGGESREMRKLYVEKLASFKTSDSVEALVKTSLIEPDREIRVLALEGLKEYGAPSAVASYLGILNSENPSPQQVTAALRALNYFPDPELWRDYVDALVTEHKGVKPPGAGMNVGRSSTGGLGLSMGGKSEVEVIPRQNRGARELLQEISGGVDYGYDQAAWRRHFAELLVGSPGDLRRDP